MCNQNSVLPQLKQVHLQVFHLLLNIQRITRDQTVSRRSEPSSRTTLIGEQPNP